jgi:hypothetical protein
MEGMEAPEGTEPVIGVVGQPVGSVHGHDREGDEQPAGPLLRRAQLEPVRMTADQCRRPDTEQGHQRDHHDGVQGEKAGVLDVAAGQDRTTLGRPDPFADPGPDHQGHEQRSGELGPARREHGAKAALPE